MRTSLAWHHRHFACVSATAPPFRQLRTCYGTRPSNVEGQGLLKRVKSLASERVHEWLTGVPSAVQLCALDNSVDVSNVERQGPH